MLPILKTPQLTLINVLNPPLGCLEIEQKGKLRYPINKNL